MKCTLVLVEGGGGRNACCTVLVDVTGNNNKSDLSFAGMLNTRRTTLLSDPRRTKEGEKKRVGVINFSLWSSVFSVATDAASSLYLVSVLLVFPWTLNQRLVLSLVINCTYFPTYNRIRIRIK